MKSDPLAGARAARSAGTSQMAVDLAWKAVRPAVIARDDVIIRQVMQFAEEIATTTADGVQDDAKQLAEYCEACLIRPRDTAESPWSMKRLLGRRGTPMKRCPDCAESIQLDARVCRFCGRAEQRIS